MEKRIFGFDIGIASLGGGLSLILTMRRILKTIFIRRDESSNRVCAVSPWRKIRKTVIPWRNRGAKNGCCAGCAAVKPDVYWE